LTTLWTLHILSRHIKIELNERFAFHASDAFEQTIVFILQIRLVSRFLQTFRLNRIYYFLLMFRNATRDFVQLFNQPIDLHRHDYIEVSLCFIQYKFWIDKNKLLIDF